ncbi:MAG: uncharacterized protein QG565_182 [Campylobacterota bacterium]|nr:uncharacterized protein [Campylobacterota bacterium]
MIRKTFKNINSNEKLKAFIQKYNIPFQYLSINRKMIANGIAVGVFVSLIIMPMQTLIILLVMPFIRFNIPIAVAMTWLSNPFTTPFILYTEYTTGSFLLGMQPTEVEITLEWFIKNLKSIFVPLYAGTAFYSIIGSILAYYFVNRLWRSSVKKDNDLRKNGRTKTAVTKESDA